MGIRIHSLILATSLVATVAVGIASASVFDGRDPRAGNLGIEPHAGRSRDREIISRLPSSLSQPRAAGNPTGGFLLSRTSDDAASGPRQPAIMGGLGSIEAGGGAGGRRPGRRITGMRISPAGADAWPFEKAQRSRPLRLAR